jgi:hypothetical protein
LSTSAPEGLLLVRAAILVFMIIITYRNSDWMWSMSEEHLHQKYEHYGLFEKLLFVKEKYSAEAVLTSADRTASTHASSKKPKVTLADALKELREKHQKKTKGDSRSENDKLTDCKYPF